MSLTDSKLRVALGDALDPAFARDALRSGLDPQNYAAHSLRSGFATSAARANKSETAIMRQGRWKSIPVARRYIRAGSRWHDHAGTGIGL